MIFGNKSWYPFLQTMIHKSVCDAALKQALRRKALSQSAKFVVGYDIECDACGKKIANRFYYICFWFCDFKVRSKVVDFGFLCAYFYFCELRRPPCSY